jgi:ketosteroid isomerase-like protein
MPGSIAPRDLVEGFLRHVDRGEWEALPQFYSNDALVEQPFAKPEPIVLRGRDTIRAHFLAASRAPMTLSVLRPVVLTTSDPEVVVAEYDYEIEATKTGRRAVVANVQIFRIRRGEIVASRDFHDHAAFGALLRP